MKHLRRNILMITILVIGLNIASISAFAETTASITIEPSEPTRQSTINFTAEITTDETIQEVTLIVQECKEGLCFSKNDVTMELLNDEYAGVFTLASDGTTYIQYWLEIVTDQGTVETEAIQKNLKIDSNNGNTNGGSSNNDESPGFELVFVLVAIVIAVMFFKRKR